MQLFAETSVVHLCLLLPSPAGVQTRQKPRLPLLPEAEMYLSWGFLWNSPYLGFYEGVTLLL